VKGIEHLWGPYLRRVNNSKVDFKKWRLKELWDFLWDTVDVLSSACRAQGNESAASMNCGKFFFE